jgi:hypothetical protein
MAAAEHVTVETDNLINQIGLFEGYEKFDYEYFLN